MVFYRATVREANAALCSADVEVVDVMKGTRLVVIQVPGSARCSTPPALPKPNTTGKKIMVRRRRAGIDQEKKTQVTTTRRRWRADVARSGARRSHIPQTSSLLR
jgi:hypothetical protein